ncbi:unnamed protein product [Dovyalis caffra]|uniref:BAG domain-containing protein n=1 Tax=Dovyalis caffra TaxID=77055 RepID=A0AAV1SF20_9ROSI|nr:unnamed protein product [Dovyalis caffra]
MDSHPIPGEVPHMQHYHPSFGAIPPHMHVDPYKSGSVHGHWPSVNNFGYSAQCQACCGHGNFSGYYIPRPPCPHFPPSQYQCYGYPPYHEAVPVQYVPPPHYWMEHPSYGYDKVVSSNNRCCGCPSHTHNHKSDERVKVEELDPEVQKKEADSLVPFQVKNYPYPILWIPPDNIKNKEPRKPVESEMTSREKLSHGTEAPKSVKASEQEPRWWNGWFPLDMKSAEPLMQAEDQKRTQNHQNEEKMQQFPFPRFWLPPYNKQYGTANEDDAETNASPKPVDELPSPVKFFPVKLPGSNDGSNKLKVVQDHSRDQVGSETEGERVINQKGTPVKQLEMLGEKEGVKQKSIPVEQMEAFGEKENSEGIDKRGRTISLINAEGDRTINASGTCAKGQSSSPPKTSKLPPVCLRVDPLPKKKNGSSGSRSPSPPGSKRQPGETSKDPTQVQDGALSSSKEVEANKKEGKVEVVERNSIANKDSETRNGSQTPTLINFTDPQKEVFRSAKAEESETHDDKYVNKEDQGARDAGDLTAGKATKSKEVTDAKGKRRLSDEEAALLIQSAYRGFEVRRWEPLKKLKQIAQVRVQVAEVKDKIHALEASSDLQKDHRQRVVIGEMIMSLLLKLDAIQGLQPTLRDIRKSLARELVALQEKLDSLIMERCEETAEQKTSEDNLVVSSNTTVKQDAPKIEAGEHPSYLLSQMDALGDSEDKEITKSPIPVKEELRKSEDEVREVEINGGAHVAERENKVGSGEFLSSEVVMTENGQGVIVPSATEQTVLFQSQASDKEEIRRTLSEDICCSPLNEQQFEVTKLTNVETNPDVNRIEAPLHEISGKVAAISDEEEVRGTAIVAIKDGEEMKSNASTSASTEKTSEVNLLKELPLGLIDEEAPEKRENEIPSGGDNKADTEPSSQNEVVMIPIESEQQCMELHNEGASAAESEDSVKAGLEKDNSHENAMVGVCMQQPEALEVHNDEQQVEVLGPEKELFSEEQEESNEEKNGGNVQTEDSYSSELANKVIFSQEKEVLAEEEKDNDFQPETETETDFRNEEMKLERTQYHELGVLGDHDDMGDQVDGSETTKSLSVVEPQFSPLAAEHDEEKIEVPPASSPFIASQLSADEQEMGMESDRKLVEENEKLREMMERLIETGKDQLTVISNLTHRVKDLEKKLSKKKARSRRWRTATPPSNARPLVKSPRRAGVAV